MHRSRATRTRLAARLIGCLLALVLVAPDNPLWALLAPFPSPLAINTTEAVDVTSPVPSPHTVPPYADPHLPSLSVQIAVAPDPVVVGQPATVTVTVTNNAPDPATNLAVTLPVPSGVTARTPATATSTVAEAAPGVPTPPPPTTAWSFSQPTLAAHSTTTFTSQLQIDQLPTTGAVLLTPAATAQGLPAPVATTGGALVVDAAPVAATQAFTPGTATTLQSTDRRVRVQLPAGATDKGVTLKHDTQPPAGETAPPPLAHFKRGLSTFHLTATESGGAPVHQLVQPYTLAVQYTPEQLRARGIAERDLTFFWYDAAATGKRTDGSTITGRWTPIATHIDPTTHTATAAVNHFSAFQLSDGSSPSNAYLPSQQDWEVSNFTGSASYALPIEVPAGPGGIKPTFSLRYDSGQTDGQTGLRANQQAGWVGKGWSLDIGSVELRRIAPETVLQARFYTLSINGKSVDLARQGLVNSSYDVNDLGSLDHWNWTTRDESFMRVIAVEQSQPSYDGGNAANSRGGFFGAGNTPYKRYAWEIWAKNGTKYDFSEDSWWGFDDCAAYNDAYMETYKWDLHQITDTHSNTVTYSYGRLPAQFGTMSCNAVHGTVDRETWIGTVTWGAHSGDNNNRFQAVFTVAPRTFDTNPDFATDQYGGVAGAPQVIYQLTKIDVSTLRSDNSAWDLVRQYRLTYADSVHSVLSDATINGNQGDPTTAKLTLIGIQRVGNDGMGALPATAFTYGPTRGTDPTYPNGAWNRLTGVYNGQGGSLTFAYDNIGGAVQKNLFANYRRVTTKTVTDTVASPNVVGTWTYSYGTPELNSLGALLDTNYANEWQQYPNSAAIYLNKYWSPGTDYAYLLAHPQNTEFRGHSWTKVTDPYGLQTQHFFYQGDTTDAAQAGCTPNTSSATGQNVANYDADACYVILKQNEFRVGREWATILLGAGNAQLRRVERTYTVAESDYAEFLLSGIWHDWHVLTTETTTINEQGGALAKQTQYGYTTNAAPFGYGNVQTVKEFSDAGTTRYRQTAYTYATKDTTAPITGTGTYIVNRRAKEQVLDGGTTEKARTQWYYDNNGFATLGTTGDVTQMSAFFDLNNSSDMTYAYDGYGNRTQMKTFTGANVTGIARTTSTAYDTIYHVYPLTVTPPIGTLAETAGYDYRMGTLTSVTDPNGNQTAAAYDLFGRLSYVVKPGDTTQYPTVIAHYDDWAQPVHFWTEQRETSGTNSQHWNQSFYDGLGRLIQTKHETLGGTINTVTDTLYDGGGHAVKASQPRSVTVLGGDFFSYVARATDGVENWTTATYDLLGRPLTVTLPDTTQTQLSYALDPTGLITTTIDANQHKTARTTDLFGRLITVTEYSGNSSGTYATDATTHYQYNPLDLLTQVSDTQSHTTTLGYDNLGRKTSMSDPDLGAWSYGYDAASRMTSQTDAKNQTIGFGYDDLDRLTAMTGGNTATYTYDVGTNGKGHRTTATNPAATINYAYDTRGRVTSQTESVAGQTGTWTTGFAYNAADKPTTLTYPVTNEQVTYAYDAAWRPTSVCTNSGGCYASSATYTALDQPTSMQIGNGTGALLDQWSYTAQLSRLSRIQVGASQQSPSTVFDRAYAYDTVGNVTQITNNLAVQTQQTFTYDHRDRLTHATGTGSGAYDEGYGYDPIGNLTSKAGVTYSYGGSGHAHAPSSVGGDSYSYDLDGNVMTGGGRTYTWNPLNLPTRIIAAATPPNPTGGTPNLTAPSRGGSVVGGTPNLTAPSRGGPVVGGSPSLTAPSRGVGTVLTTQEDYTYDADNQRVTRTVNGVTTTVYIGGIFEQDMGVGISRSQYTLGGKVIAQRQIVGSTPTVVYLHGDHLGSISVATNTSGGILDQQEYGPWGAIRSGGVPETTLNYTGQKRDGTGLLYYGARYYDPILGRFLSPDIMGTSLGNPQSLNRYSYVGNNPLNHTDPTGHCGQPEGEDCGATTPLYDGNRSGLGSDLGGHDESGAAAFADLVSATDQLAASSNTFHPFAFIGTGCSDPSDLDCVNNSCSAQNAPCFPTGSGPPGIPTVRVGVTQGPFGPIGVVQVDANQNPGGGTGGNGPRNPNGRRGGAAHQGVIDDVIQQGKSLGLEHIGGSGSNPNGPKELTFDTPGGDKGRRSPDVSFYNPETGEQTHVNVGRTISSGEPVIRERRALDDLRKQGVNIEYVPYDEWG